MMWKPYAHITDANAWIVHGGTPQTQWQGNATPTELTQWKCVITIIVFNQWSIEMTVQLFVTLMSVLAVLGVLFMGYRAYAYIGIGLLDLHHSRTHACVHTIRVRSASSLHQSESIEYRKRWVSHAQRPLLLNSQFWKTKLKCWFYVTSLCLSQKVIVHM